MFNTIKFISDCGDHTLELRLALAFIKNDLLLKNKARYMTGL